MDFILLSIFNLILGFMQNSFINYLYSQNRIKLLVCMAAVYGNMLSLFDR